MDQTFINHSLDLCLVHLLEVNAMIPDGERGARWRPDDPIWFGLADKFACSLAVRCLGEILAFAVGLLGTDVKRVETLDVEIPARGQIVLCN